ncbi:MAG: M48 family metalloprotease [Candidatus Baltobacteraceae bacterium]
MKARNLALGAAAGFGTGYALVRAIQAWKLLQAPPAASSGDAAAYGRRRRAIAACGVLRSLAGTAAFAFGPLAARTSCSFARLPRWARPGAYFGAVAAAGMLFELPVEFVEEYALERSYGLSEQRASAWGTDALKSMALNAALASAIGLIGGVAFRRFPKTWPFAASAGLLPLLVLGNVVVPLYILPLFNAFEPLHGPLETRLRSLASRFDVGDAEILRMDMSRQTKKANAFVTGIGSTHRIVLGDTLIDRFEANEIEFVVAHELGHYVGKDTWRLIAVSEICALLLFFAASAAVKVERDDDSTALMRVYAYLSSGLFLLQPAINAFSRSREWAADRFALAATNAPISGAAAFRRLRDQNLAEDEIPAWYEFFFGSHPSLGKRISALEHS